MAGNHAGGRISAERDLERLLFFSDAVIAIAITLLVIDLRVPNLARTASDADLRSAIVELTPRLFSVFLSFAVIGLWWTSHHRFFGAVARLDGWLLALNLVFLAAIAFLPFPTSILGGWSVSTSVALYAATNATIGFLAVAMRIYAERRGLLDPGVPLEAFGRRTYRSLVAPVVFLASIPVAYVSPGSAIWTWNLIWILTIVVRQLQGPAGAY
jgi:uncharacterized membrane protein